MNVLLIEDDLDVAFMVVAALAVQGIECDAVTTDFASVLHVERWKHVDVGVVDILLGNSITGIDILGWMKEWVPGIRRISYSAVVAMHPRVVVLADAVVLKGDIGDLFEALGV